jgi:hypothetical protein
MSAALRWMKVLEECRLQEPVCLGLGFCATRIDCASPSAFASIWIFLELVLGLLRLLLRRHFLLHPGFKRLW